METSRGHDLLEVYTLKPQNTSDLGFRNSF